MSKQSVSDRELVTILSREQAEDRKLLKTLPKDSDEAKDIRSRLMWRRKGRNGIRALNNRLTYYYSWCDNNNVWAR